MNNKKNFAVDELEFQKVLGLIVNEAISELGKNKILCLAPTNDFHKIKNELDIIDEAKKLLIDNKPLPLNFIPDISKEIKQSEVVGYCLPQQTFFIIREILKNTKTIKSYLKTNFDFISKLKFQYQLLDELLPVSQQIDNVFDHNGNVRNNASPKLAEIRYEIQEKTSQLNNVIQRIIINLQKNGYLRETSPSINDGRLVLPVKAEHKRKINGFIHTESATGQTVYIEPAETLNLNNEILSLKFEEQREIERILRELTRFISQYANAIILNIETLAYIDSVFARAKYSIKYDCNNVILEKDENILVLLNARHPLLLHRLGKEKTVPFSLNFKGRDVIVITGPNTGGKSVLLKSVGILSLMIQSGIQVPASPDSTFPVFNMVLVDIGDKQSIEEDLSTFSSHLLNIKEIINSIDNKSLVLLDEIGTGTDPEQGASIALATLVTLQQKGAKVIASTHLGKVKVVVSSLSGFENASMQFDKENLMPNYQFMQGIPGSSFAIEIIRKNNFHDEFLSLVEKFSDDDNLKLENMISNLQEQYKNYYEQNKKLNVELSRYAALEKLYNEKANLLEKEKKQILLSAKKEAKEYLSQINKQVEQEIANIRNSQGDKETIRQARKNIAKVVEDFNKEFEKNLEDKKVINYEFNVGDFVQIKDTQYFGTIQSINRTKLTAEVLADGLKIQTDLYKLLPAKKSEAKKTLSTSNNVSLLDVSYRIDLRGKRANEIYNELITFLDDAYTAGLQRVEILHGKGTGALKEKVKQILNDQPYVKKYYHAPIEAGGEGITIVEIA